MTEGTRLQAIRDYVNDVLLSGQAVDDEENLLLGGLVDSIGVMSLVTFLEQGFGFAVAPDEVTVENFLSIAAIDAFAGGKMAG
jgi:acyl carrier protein